MNGIDGSDGATGGGPRKKTPTEEMMALPWRVQQDCCGGCEDGWLIMNDIGRVVMRPRQPGKYIKHLLDAIVNVANREGARIVDEMAAGEWNEPRSS